eukprot:TRINITY_DN23134_c0_g1_i1.p1 TRINITY_DN23134_c0_g1~~TRINITY_DN23134_c0_g1_i1.p1  ORF type:complete len:281 (-),score=42.40 TRINITY_DN23134_c0_g1_i1:454-1296(-)
MALVLPAQQTLFQLQDSVAPHFPERAILGPYLHRRASSADEMDDGSDSDSSSDDEGREACSNIAGLLLHLGIMEQKGQLITEVTHVVNKWMIHGVTLPMKHHGLILRMGYSHYLRLHLVREGLAWKAYDSAPELPQTACYAKTYTTCVNAEVLRQYCKETKPWSWPANDCEAWAHGALNALGVKEELYKSLQVPQLPIPSADQVNQMWRSVVYPVHDCTQISTMPCGIGASVFARERTFSAAGSEVRERTFSAVGSEIDASPCYVQPPMCGYFFGFGITA